MMPFSYGRSTPPRHPNYHFPLTWIQDECVVKALTVRDFHRREWENTVDTVHVGENALVEELTVTGLTLENHLPDHCAKLLNGGRIGELRTDCLAPEEIENEGAGSFGTVTLTHG